MKSHSTKPIVIVLDDDPDVRARLKSMLETVHLESKMFASVRAFWRSRLPERPSCLITETRMSDGDGLDLQDKLRRDGSKLPIIFVTRFGDIRVAVRAMKSGASDFLAKPVREQSLLDAVHDALERDRERREANAKQRALIALVEKLPPSYQTVLRLTAEGWTNKEIGDKMRVGDSAIRWKKCLLRRKFGVKTNPDLMRTGWALSLMLGLDRTADAASNARTQGTQVHDQALDRRSDQAA